MLCCRLFKHTDMPITISKELFVEAIEAIKAQQFHDFKCCAAFAIVFPDAYTTLYNNGFIGDALLKMLKVGMCDEGENSWIEYFMWELEFGKRYREGCVRQDDVPIDISTPDLLWEFLVKSAA